MTTAGEKLAEREFRKERRAGVEHFVPGQHEAVEDGDCPGVFILSYVDNGGHVVVLPVEREGDRWSPVGVGVRAGQELVEARALRENFELSERMLAALDAAAGRT